MDKPIIIITGSSGFLGSAICVDLSPDSRIVGMDCREPSPDLQQRATGVQWLTIDIADSDGLRSLFNRVVHHYGRVDYVLHMAAFYHFGQRWLPEDERVNVQGLRNVLECATHAGVGRFIFAGSIASLPPPPTGEDLSEASTPTAATAYTRSKTIGEALLARYSDRMPAVALRIGGVFSDWCELPPLYSLMKLWSQPNLLGRMIPGRGASGFPYIHRRDLVKAVRKVIERHDQLAPFDILFAAPPGCTTHNELFDAIHRAASPHLLLQPIHISPALARCFLMMKNSIKVMVGRKRYERRWMMDYVDTPLVVDTSLTQRKLQWTPGPRLSVVNRLPVLMKYFLTDRSAWERRNIDRNEGRYEFKVGA